MDSRAGRCGRGQRPASLGAAPPREQGARVLVLRDGTGDMGLQRWWARPRDGNGPTLRFVPPADPGAGIFVLEVGLRGPRPL